MLKKILFGMVLTGLLGTSSMAMADIGLQVGIPYMIVSGDSKVSSGASGAAIALTFDFGHDMNIGIYNEQMTYKTSGDAAGNTTASITGLRVNKFVTDPFYLGVGLGTATFAAGTSSVVGDVLVGAKVYPTSKGKVSTYIDFELGYRMMKPTAAVIGATDFGGIRSAINVGLSF